jgi:hypothetical protein
VDEALPIFGHNRVVNAGLLALFAQRRENTPLIALLVDTFAR